MKTKTAAPPRVLLLLWQTTIGSAITAIPAFQAIIGHYEPQTEYWLLIRPPKDSASSHPAELLQPWLGLTGVLSTPHRLAAPLQWLTLLYRVRQLRFQATVYVDLSQPHQVVKRVLTGFSYLAGLGRPQGLPKQTPRHNKTLSESTRRLTNLLMDGISAISNDHQRVFPAPRLSADLEHWLASQRRPGRRLIAICPGARASANHWPLQRFADIGHRLLARNDCDLLICGGRDERVAALTLQAQWQHGIIAAGAHTLAETAAMLSHCDLVIGLDTGTSHMAAILGVQTIVLQGGRCHAGQWDPLGPHVQVLRWPVPCTACGHKVCPLQSHPCMRGLPVEQVWRAVSQMLPLRAA